MTPALLALAFAGTATAAGFDPAQLLGTLTLQDIGQTVGLAALALLFASDRILTKGQHERRIADLEKAHAALFAERDNRLSDMTTSRDYYREARNAEAERADALAGQLGKLAAEASRSASETMTALEEAAREAASDA